MEITKINQRYYLVDENGKRLKMIPQQYIEVALANSLEIYENFHLLRLSFKERLRLEVALFVRNLKEHKKYVWEQIKDKEFEGANYMVIRNGENKYCAVFNGMQVVCPEKIYKLAKKTLYFTDIIHVNG